MRSDKFVDSFTTTRVVNHVIINSQRDKITIIYANAIWFEVIIEMRCFGAILRGDFHRDTSRK